MFALQNTGGGKILLSHIVIGWEITLARNSQHPGIHYTTGQIKILLPLAYAWYLRPCLTGQSVTPDERKAVKSDLKWDAVSTWLHRSNLPYAGQSPWSEG